MKPIISTYGIPLGISSTFWLIIGITRAISESIHGFWKKKTKRNRFKVSDIAAIIPAHNEELVIRECIQALKESLPKKQIYVVSDGSRDKTYQKASMEGCHVLSLIPGRGKGGAMVYLIDHFDLYKRYKLIFIVDADTKIDKNFVKGALRLFKDPDTNVVFGSARINWPQHIIPRFSLYLIAYRERLNRMLQFFYVYGQTWKYTNTNYVIPGFATIYKSKVLRKLEIDTPGLIIEDFNLAFQFHKKKLGRIGYHPGMIGWDQHPDNLPDYWKQVRRWNIGFFQTVKKNGIWPSFFWLALGVFTIEVFLNSILVLFVPILIIVKLSPYISHFIPQIGHFASSYISYGPFTHLSLSDILISIFLYDYFMSVMFGLMGRKPQFIFYGLFFFFMHLVTSLVLISSLIPGFFSQSSGRWVSPKRHLLVLKKM